MVHKDGSGSGELRTELVTSASEIVIRDIEALEPLFPGVLRYDENKIVDYLKNPDAVSMLLKRGEHVVGYILAIPHNLAREEDKNDDPLMEDDPHRYYIDQVAVIPEERKGLTFLYLVYDLLDELDKRGHNKISSHIISANGLGKLIVRVFGKMLTLRRSLTLPSYGDLPVEYIEGVYAPERN